MDDFEVRQVLSDIQFEVRNFKKSRGKDTWNWSCTVCGDSQTKERAARFGVARKDGAWVCHCFNCGYSNTLISYLKAFHPNLYSRITVSSFLQLNPELYSLDHLFEKTSKNVLRHIFFINKFRNTKYWLDHLQNKNVRLKTKNLKTLYTMHKEYWNE